MRLSDVTLEHWSILCKTKTLYHNSKQPSIGKNFIKSYDFLHVNLLRKYFYVIDIFTIQRYGKI